ncbi:MAG: stage V sporulation T C-terminal domain-containing protein, partial [Bacilli bacterium]
KENSKKYIDIFNKIYNYEIILTDRDKVVYSTVDNQNLEAIKLTNDIVRSIEERKEYKNTTLKLSSDIILNCNYLFIPVIIDTDALGSLILISNHDIKHEDELNLRLLYHLIKLELL